MAEILIVEDDKAIQNLLKIALKQENHNVMTVGTAREGIDYTVKNIVDVMILDLGLPDMDGINVVKTVREFNEKMPILVVSARDDENEYCIFSPVFRIGETDWFVPTHLLGVARDTFSESWEDESFPLVAGGRADVEAFYRRTNLYTVSPDEDGFTLTFQEGEEVYSMRVSFSETEAGTTVAFSAI